MGVESDQKITQEVSDYSPRGGFGTVSGNPDAEISPIVSTCLGNKVGRLGEVKRISRKGIRMRNKVHKAGKRA
jgi:hypothetical protein